MSLLSIDELAARLRTTPNALYCRRARDVKALPPNVVIPGDSRLLFKEDVVEQWLIDPTVFQPKPAGRPRKPDLYPMPRKSSRKKGGSHVSGQQGVQP
jgi:hypothetical protein